MAKVTVLATFGAGYVLGARAGRRRYDQIAEKAQQVWRNPRVQRTATQVRDVASEKASQAAAAATYKAAEAAASVQATVQDKVADITSDEQDQPGHDAASPGPNPADITSTAPPTR